MTASESNRIVFLWACRHGYECDICDASGSDGPQLMVQLDHAVGYFDRGRLVRLDTRRDGRFADELAIELANVFALCGYIAMHAAPPDPRRACERTEIALNQARPVVVRARNELRRLESDVDRTPRHASAEWLRAPADPSRHPALRLVFNDAFVGESGRRNGECCACLPPTTRRRRITLG